MTSDRDHPMMFSGYLLALRRCLNCKRSSSRVISRPCYCLTFLDTIFYVWSVARGKVCKLKKVSVSERKNSLCLVSLRWINLISINAMKILANDTAIFVPTAVPCVWRKFS